MAIGTVDTEVKVFAGVHGHTGEDLGVCVGGVLKGILKDGQFNLVRDRCRFEPVTCEASCGKKCTAENILVSKSEGRATISEWPSRGDVVCGKSSEGRNLLDSAESVKSQ